MNYFREQREYLKDNPQGYWFKRKLYGWGWTPARSQGWIAIAAYIVGVLFVSFHVDKNASSFEVVLTSIVPVVILTSLLIALCYIKGEKPKWQWGIQTEDKN